MARSSNRSFRTPVQVAAAVVGAVFLLVGVLGFVPGITAGQESMRFAGPHSGALLMGLFQVSVLHNIVHLLFGAAGVLAARSWRGSQIYLVAGGVLYLMVWLYGMLIDRTSSVNFVPVNAADNWLHLFLGLGMIALGYVLAARRPKESRH
ncbi:DUF4383 domain-containing protein [Nonomuraea indica]|uniref:DUF4383 domain-containing protein n=1 Tax=Nonomuraea indica TaxID=1581193 RepID=A0ABW7ZY30_9ACTN|nr:DUF4383 domain-containing protein [Nonomuraea indica]